MAESWGFDQDTKAIYFVGLDGAQHRIQVDGGGNFVVDGAAIVGAVAIAVETARATAAEAELDTDLTEEATRADGAETTNATAVAAETTRATAAEGSDGWHGVWAIGTTYGVSAIVTGSDSHCYISKAAGNVGHDPTSDAGVHWQALAA